MTTEPTVPSGTESIWIDASPEAVWRNVSDIANLARHSPETIRTEWLGDAERPEVGARFRGHNRRGSYEWHADCEITELHERSEFEFGVGRGNDGEFSARWRYTLTPERGGTRLTESFEAPLLATPPDGMDPKRVDVLGEMLHATLAAIKVDVEAGT